MGNYTQALEPVVHSIPQAQQRLGIGSTTFFNLLKSGDLKSIKIGARTLIPESEIQRFVQARINERSAA
jgi:excisionase family DNA binding protein